MEKFEAKLLLGNTRGTGLVKLPKGSRLEKNQRIEVKASPSGATFFARVITARGSKAFYVPKKMAQDMRKTSEIFAFAVDEINGFYSTVTTDGRINLPIEIVESNNIADGDAIIISSASRAKYGKISLRERKRKREFTCQFFSDLAGENRIFKVRKLQKTIPTTRLQSSLAKEIELYDDGKKTIAMHGQKQPVNINQDICESDIAHFLGAYYADGTKIGNNWGICASTIEQGNYYLSSHGNIILDARPVMELSYTEKHRQNEESPLKKWNASGIKVEKIRVRRPIGKNDGLKRSENGSLVIKENRKLTQIIYNTLIKAVAQKIIEEKNEALALDFIMGVIEGDGAANSKTHGHILIASNAREIKLIDDILDYCNFKHKVFKEKGNSWFARIHGLSLLQALPKIIEKIFKYYPKRRKKFAERLLGLGICRYLLGEERRTSAWTKSLLKENGILDSNYKPTEKGEKLVACLKELEKELRTRNWTKSD